MNVLRFTPAYAIDVQKVAKNKRQNMSAACGQYE